MPLKFLLYLFSRHQLTIKVIIIMKNKSGLDDPIGLVEKIVFVEFGSKWAR